MQRHVAYDFANPHGHVFDRWGQEFVTDGTGNDNYYALPFCGRVVHPDKHTGYFTFFQQRSRPCGGTEILSSRHFPPERASPSRRRGSARSAPRQIGRAAPS